MLSQESDSPLGALMTDLQERDAHYRRLFGRLTPDDARNLIDRLQVLALTRPDTVRELETFFERDRRAVRRRAPRAPAKTIRACSRARTVPSNASQPFRCTSVRPTATTNGRPNRADFPNQIFGFQRPIVVPCAVVRDRRHRSACAEGMTPTLIGIAGGSVAALASARLLEKLVFGVSAAGHPLTLAAVAGTLAFVALVQRSCRRIARPGWNR